MVWAQAFSKWEAEYGGLEIYKNGGHKRQDMNICEVSFFHHGLLAIMERKLLFKGSTC